VTNQKLILNGNNTVHHYSAYSSRGAQAHTGRRGRHPRPHHYTDSPDNWREITDAEADALRAEIEAAAEREQSQAKVYAEVDE
jgi:hypothetical protein